MGGPAAGFAQTYRAELFSSVPILYTSIDKRFDAVDQFDGTVEHIEFPGGNNTQGYGVNDRGTVIGVYSDDAGAPHAFERIKGVYRNLDLPNGFATTPLFF